MSAAIAVALGLSALVAWRAAVTLREQLGAEFARNTTLLAKQRILTPLSRELALARRFASSDVLRQWLLDENDAAKKAALEREAEGYRQDFSDRSFFVVSAGSLGYYYADELAPSIREPRYHVDPAQPRDAWFFRSLGETRDYNINVDVDRGLALTKVWINVVTTDRGRKLAMSGTGLDLTRFLKELIADAEPGVTPLILSAAGDIQLHPDPSQIARGSGIGGQSGDKTLFRLIPGADEPAARRALADALAAPQNVFMFTSQVDGRRQLVAVSWLPELQWYLTSVVDLDVARVLDSRDFLLLAVAVLLLLTLFSGASVFGINRLLIVPLLRLEKSAQSMASGNYDLQLPPAAADEIGELTRAFGGMAATVRRHTRELESTVQMRTRELVAANEEMSQAHEKIRSSIEYASLMQRNLLPDPALSGRFDDRHAVLWLPRDVVGGDIYLFRESEAGFLVGVIDCAGHGVPGALATMLAWSALDNAMVQAGLDDPAAILKWTDTAVRGLAPAGAAGQSVTTTMDAALVWVDPQRQRARFAGAKLSVFLSSAGVISEYKGGRHALGDRRVTGFDNIEFACAPGDTLHLVTDGLFDQAGGDKGYGFGQARFVDLLRADATGSPREQLQRITESLGAWQGARPQRDDITLISIPL